MKEPNYYSPIRTVAEDVYKDFWNDKEMFDNRRAHHTIVTPIRK